LGPAARYPYSNQRIYTPPDCTQQDYLALVRALGIDRAVLVQPSVYGTDNQAMLDMLLSAPISCRGVAVVGQDIASDDLLSLHQAGVRGLRCNVVDVKEKMPGVLPIDHLLTLAKKIAPMGWHLELLAHVDEYPDLYQALRHFPVPVVFGHFGYARVANGVDSDGFQGFLELLREQKAWAKMSGPYRISGQTAPPYSDVLPIAATVLAANPKQLVWGTDWPHVMVTSAMPNDADLCDLLSDWLPTPELQRQVLINNPERLYDF
jgi:predicted TIM-barrel fold metal-dependent hydrolase